MKNLILIRHAKSDWSDLDAEDFDRGLSDRGFKQIKKISKIIDFFEIQKIICSSSKRTILTYNGLKENSKNFGKIPVEFSREIYDIHQKNVIDFIEIIRCLPNDLDKIAFVGHNSIFDETIKFFTKTHLHLPTCSIIEIAFDDTVWNCVHSGKIVNFITPKK